MISCAQHACKCRVAVLNNMKSYGVHPKHKQLLLKNLNFFRKLVLKEQR